MRFCAALALLAVLGLSCRRPRQDQEPNVPEVQLFGVRMHSFRGSSPVASGTAAQLTYQRDPADVKALEPRLLLPANTGASMAGGRDAEISAPLAVGNLISRTADGLGGVRLRAASGLQATTERAHFDGVRLLASGQEPVRVQGPGYFLQALGFVWDLRTDELSFDGPVRSRIGGTSQ